jgi:pyruvate/2-oxoglutarate/acetoin dehydrogenase E1 component/TPP-dependent pyruvate/acetoin dehydrogenase alpha subunit
LYLRSCTNQFIILKDTIPAIAPISLTKQEIISDYYTCCLSREVSILIRKEVLTGKAKFGVSDDGKELFQVAMARAYRKGDFRSDYYRGHTLLLALDLCTVEDLLAQLYADAENDPFSGGRQMNNHHATPLVDADGRWLPHKERYNLSSDISTTGGQMARAVGLALASKKYREAAERQSTPFSNNGNEICFCIIGDASTSEGAFWEAVNAACVQQIPMAVTIADDGYGISVPKAYQTTKESISEALAGFQTEGVDNGLEIYQIKGWSYPELCTAYTKGISRMRKTHRPALFHIEELTQPQGHSTSGSHERYKSKDRLAWEAEYDCNKQFRKWILEEGIATEEELVAQEKKAKATAKAGRDTAWKAYAKPLADIKTFFQQQYQALSKTYAGNPRFEALNNSFKSFYNPFRADYIRNVRRLIIALKGEQHPALTALREWLDQETDRATTTYRKFLYSEGEDSALRVPVVAPRYSEESTDKNGFEIINAFFDKALNEYDNLYAFGEDVGKIGDVNQGFAGLQEKYGEERVFDTGIREWTIIGQAIGMAMRGLRPIAEIQYLDYLIYAFSPLSDDLATVRYRSNNQQIAPAIIRTRGHRLEGIWHSGSPMGVLLSGLRGIYVCVPRNMVQAAGMYNTLLQSGDPGLVIECLNGYRLKEKKPDNLGEYTVPLGVPEVLCEGTDVTLVTYGSCVRIAQQAIDMLAEDGVSVELIDVQTLLPFDLEHRIVASLKKTNRIVFLDEDLPGSASAYMLQKVIVEQKGYYHLDSEPVTISANEHRPPYGSDGDYFSKPNVEDVYEAVYNLIHESDPQRFAL